MNMFRHELRVFGRAASLWSLSLAALAAVFLSLFPVFAQNAAEMNALLQGFPEPVRNAFGISLDSIATLPGFYAMIFLYVTLGGAIQAMILGTSLFSREERDKTADFLLSKPVARQQIFGSKILAAISILTATNLIFVAGASLSAARVSREPYSLKVFFLISITLFLVQLMFAALGMLTSLLVRRVKSVLSLSLGTVFGLFIVNMFNSLVGDPTLRYLSPFSYYTGSYIIANAGYEPPFLLAEALFVTAALAATYYLYGKKDFNPL